MELNRRNLLATGLAAAGGIALAKLSSACTTVHADAGADPSAMSPLRIQIALFDGFEVTDALAPFDVFKIASKVGAAIEVTLVSVNGAKEVVALDDVHVQPTGALDSNADILVVPGAPALWRMDAMPPDLEDTLLTWREAGKTLATVCTGAVFAARARLLQGRNATTHRAAQDVIRDLGAVLQPARVVDDGDLISSGGVTSGIDLALHLVERYAGAAIAIKVEQAIEYERRGTVFRA